MSRIDWFGIIFVLCIAGSCAQENYYKHIEK